YNNAVKDINNPACIPREMSQKKKKEERMKDCKGLPPDLGRRHHSHQHPQSTLSHISNSYSVPASACEPLGTSSPTHASISSCPLLRHPFLSSAPPGPPSAASSSRTGKKVSHSNSVRTLVSSTRLASRISSAAR